MSLTDQAFIRAYHPAAEQPGPAHTAQPNSVSVAEQLSSNTLQHSAELGNSVQYAACDLPDVPDAFSDVSGASSTPYSDSNAYEHEPRSTKPTLASYLSSTEPEPSGTTPEMLVSQFIFPKICQQLTSRYAERLATTVDHLLNLAASGQSMIGIAGTSGRAGATTTLLCLAQQLASQGKSVALVDADFTNPTLATRLGISPNKTWQDVMLAGTPLAEALVHSADDKLILLPSAIGALPISAERFESARLQASVTAGVLRYAHDLVLVDLGTISTSAPSSLLESLRLDGALLVLSATEPAEHPIHHARQTLAQLNCRTLGIIENFVQPVKS